MVLSSSTTSDEFLLVVIPIAVDWTAVRIGQSKFFGKFLWACPLYHPSTDVPARFMRQLIHRLRCSHNKWDTYYRAQLPWRYQRQCRWRQLPQSELPIGMRHCCNPSWRCWSLVALWQWSFCCLHSRCTSSEIPRPAPLGCTSAEHTSIRKTFRYIRMSTGIFRWRIFAVHVPSHWAKVVLPLLARALMEDSCCGDPTMVTISNSGYVRIDLISLTGLLPVSSIKSKHHQNNLVGSILHCKRVDNLAIGWINFSNGGWEFLISGFLNDGFHGIACSI